jgi:hypothetical protein
MPTDRLGTIQKIWISGDEEYWAMYGKDTMASVLWDGRRSPEATDVKELLIAREDGTLSPLRGHRTKKPPEERRGPSTRVRFEVLKRDGFACVYCGRKAPEVVLHVDHVKPVSKGGRTVMANLVAACQPCNAGKSDNELPSENAVENQPSI